MSARTQDKPSKYNKTKLSHSNLICAHEDCKENILTFATSKDLKKHTKKSHSPAKLHKCGFQDCGEIFPKKSELKKHATIHRKKHVCPVEECSIEMPSRKAWRNHVKANHPDSDEGKLLVQEEETKKLARVDPNTNQIQNLIEQIKKLELRVRDLESKVTF
jgi:uncharacterized Zn-finger protein